MVDINRELNNSDEVSSDATLLVQGGPRNGEIISLTSEITTLGRQQDNDIVIDDPAVSRSHSAIVAGQSGYRMRDLGSTNGTFVNRTRIFNDEHPLSHGDLVRLGGSEITFLFRYTGEQTVKISLVDPPIDSLVVDTKARQVFVKGKRLEPPLPRKEFDLLMLLSARRGEAVSRDDIATEVWPERLDGDVGNHEIEQCVHRVRTRIEEDTSKPQYLVTMRGFGYKLN